MCGHLVDGYKWHLVVNDKTYVKIPLLEEYLSHIDPDIDYLLGEMLSLYLYNFAFVNYQNHLVNGIQFN